MIPRSDASWAGDDRTSALTYAVDVRREGPQAWVQVSGRLTALARGHLDDWLDWLISTGARQVTVALAAAEQIDEDCLSVLRVARAGLRSRDGELLVIAGLASAGASVPTDAPAQPEGARR